MPFITPIPGATRPEAVLENSRLVDISEQELEEIDATLSKFEVKGARYPDSIPMNT